jgi:hypothetical protein
MGQSSARKEETKIQTIHAPIENGEIYDDQQKLEVSDRRPSDPILRASPPPE